MTHLKIELNNGIIEEVSSAVIDKLYDIVHSGNLDNTSNLIGRLHTSATYQDYIDYLEDVFKVNGVKLLIIDATKKYMSFADPEVASYWANSSYGDGTGIDSTVANSVLSIPNLAFMGNTSLLTFDELNKFVNCTTIGSWAFGECTNLTSIDSSNITSIRDHGFTNCILLTSIDLSSLTSISASCFEGCTSLTTVSNTSNISTIGNQAFYTCTSLSSIDLSGVTTLADGVFWNCTSLGPTINLSSCTSIGSHTFRECKSITSVDISSCTSLGVSIFNLCTSLTNININSSLTSIPDNCFSGCTSLTTIDLSNVTSLGGSAFNGCSALTTVTGINNITSLGGSAFRGCSSLGTGQTLELNLSNQTSYPIMALAYTKYLRLILHSQLQSGIYDARWPLYAYMNDLTYLDLSDWHPASIGNSKYCDCSFYGNDALVTYIAPITTNSIQKIISDLGNRNNFRYLILLATTPPTIEATDSNNQPARWFYQKGGHVDIYVPDSAKAAYLADTDWASIGGYNGSDTITDRLHGLSELPAGVWTTGLASLYLTQAQLATS